MRLCIGCRGNTVVCAPASGQELSGDPSRILPARAGFPGLQTLSHQKVAMQLQLCQNLLDGWCFCRLSDSGTQLLVEHSGLLRVLERHLSVVRLPQYTQDELQEVVM